MLKSLLRSTLIFLVMISAGFSADLSEELLGNMQLVEEKKYAEAIAGYEKFLQKAPEEMQPAVQFEIAALQAALNNRDQALNSMSKAIQSGFDDCLAMSQYDELKSIRTDPVFTKLKSQMRISESDLKELLWLKAEIEHVNHDTQMMITENINRVDTGFTVIPQSTLPVRPTTSPGVLFHREILKMMHLVQQQYVAQSDQTRIEHVGSMTIISGGMNQAKILESSRLAERAAEERKRAIQARKFSLPPGVPNEPQSCSN